MTEEQPKRIFEIKHIYLKDASFESPHAPQVFKKKNASSGIDANINILSSALNDEKTLFESVLMLSITAKDGEKSVFLIETQQAAIVEISGFTSEDLDKLLNIAVPNSLFPFARETIASLVAKGGFPQLLLRPMNFESIYLEKLKAQAEKTEGQQTEH